MSSDAFSRLRRGLHGDSQIHAVACDDHRVLVVVSTVVYHRDLGADVLLRAYTMLGTADYDVVVVPESDRAVLIELGFRFEGV